MRWSSTKMIAFAFADYEHLIEPLGRVADKGNFEINRDGYPLDSPRRNI